MFLTPYRTSDLSTWSPFERLTSLRDEVNRLFESSILPGWGREGQLFSGWSPALDVYQDKDNFYVSAELPGMKKEEIEISLHDGMLSITGERTREEKTGKEPETFRSERFFGRFHRTITLPGLVDSTKVQATYKDGILYVTLPKAEEAKPKQIPVKVS